MASLKDLNKIENIKPRVKKSTGERRKTASVNDDIGEALQAAETPEAVGKLAKEHGLTLEEITARAESAPNFGQFRMVIGNRIRGVVRRRENNPDLTLAEAAYPKKRAKPASGKKTTKKASKKKVSKKKTTKKTAKKKAATRGN